MKNKIKSALIAIISIMAASCAQPSKASFSINQDNSVEGKATFTYTGDPAQSYFWDFGDGESSTERSPVHYYQKNGSYFPKVVIKDKHNNASSSSNDLNVTNVKGVYTFFVRQNLGQPVNVYVDGGFIGSVTKYFSGSGYPYCQADGCAWGRFSAGKHFVQAYFEDGSLLISGSFIIESGKCAAAQLD